jgi:CRP/FNR family transcriptional regulator, cyclic AMP receptor protein
MQNRIDSTDATATIRATLERTRLFADWPDETLSKLAAGGKLHSYKHGQMQCRYGDPCTGVWVVASGRICISRSWPDGRRMIFGFLPPGQMIGFIAVFDDHAMAFDATADGDVVMAHIPSRLFLDLVLPNAALMHQVLLLLCRNSRIDYEHVQMKTMNSPRVQVAKIILYHTRGMDMASGEWRITFSQDTVGELLGLTRQTVNKELAQLIREGILSRGYANLKVKDADRLMAIAWSDEPLCTTTPFVVGPAPVPVQPESI